jgi:exopolysaccharide biosynthesis protein
MTNFSNMDTVFGRTLSKAIKPVAFAVVLAVILSAAACGQPESNPAGGGGTIAPAVSTATASATPSPNPSPSATPVPTPTATPTPTPTPDPWAQYFTDGDVLVDATSYKSADLSVIITNVSKNGQNYYVADCRMRDGNKLFTAFAKNRYTPHSSEHTSVMAQRKGAVIAVNGDYYGARSEGIVVRNGKLYRKTPFYDVAAIFKDGTMKTYAKTDTTADKLMAAGAAQVLSFGPMLMDEKGNVIPDAQLKKRSPHTSVANPRSGIGYIEPNHFVLVVVDGRSPSKGRKGMTFTQLANVFKSIGCKSAYNLDGGGSATMVFMGKVLNHPCDAGGERRVSDIVYFGEKETDKANIDRMNQ